MKSSQWDGFFNAENLEKWLYGSRSLKGKTRFWLLDRMETWDAGTTFLDAGCGGGVTAFQMNGRGLLDTIQYTGVDASDRMLELAKKKTQHPTMSWFKQDLSTLCLDQTYDCVLLRAVLEHNLNPYPIVSAVAQHVAPGGKLFIIFWNNPTDGEAVPEFDKNGFPDMPHSRNRLLSCLSNSGLYLKEECVVEEPSAKSDNRVVWVLEKSIPSE